jgi:hypothetical protein
MFPPFSHEQPRGDERLGWFTYATFNSGLLLRVIALAISAFVAAIWPRVKSRPSKR